VIDLLDRTSRFLWRSRRHGADHQVCQSEIRERTYLCYWEWWVPWISQISHPLQ
jgi:hypothetical protein